MTLKLYTDDIHLYLVESEIIDFNNPDIMKLANLIYNNSQTETQYIKNAYEYVRDHISHSADIKEDKLTYKASQVLKEGHGICFAKSHLLVALLRYKSIPAGLCYQKLVLDDDEFPFLIYHGLVGVYLKEFDKWIRLDARGNKEGINAQFSIDTEKLAFPVRPDKGEEDCHVIFPAPDKNVIKSLTENKTRTQLWNDLPRNLAFLCN